VRVVGYVRVSTADQGDSGAGMDAQRDAIRAESDRRKWELLHVEEDVLSGKTMRRPGLQRALRQCRTGDADGIIVAKLDRLSRSLLDFAALLDDARRHEYNIVALDLGVDLSTPAGELVANVMASVAQWERRAIGQRTKEALAARRAQGVRLGRPPAIPPDVRRRIVKMRSRGVPLAAIAERLNVDGVPTAHGGARWYASTVKSVVG
jgi:DNA invertase Pin-like site-specific DNA recombinase